MSKPFKFIPEESILRRPAFRGFAEDAVCLTTLMIVVANVWFWSIVFEKEKGNRHAHAGASIEAIADRGAVHASGGR